ncbi:MAG: hypothetical protein JRN11_07370 [Nitrososphaerota archaeon]|nr:hypothetical protein [Nitrososphaerota archaeon]MDG7026550.1 hypothetical protein [Nitrososphaerota archaeon]
MNAQSHRRKGIASLPVSIFFVALVVTAMVGVGTLAAGQSGLAAKQVSVDSALAARQQELSGLSASTQTGTILELHQASGVATDIVYALLQEGNDQALTEPVNYIVKPGQTLTINITSLAESITGGTLPSLSRVTLATSRGLYITSQVQTVQQTKQVTTYLQEQVQETGQRLAGYEVSQTTSAVTGYDVTETAPTSKLAGYDVTAHYPVTTQVLSGYDLYLTVARTAYACPSGWNNAGNGLCSYSYSYTTTYTTTETVMHGYEICVPIDVRTGACVWRCIWPFCWTSTVTVVNVVVHYVTVYTDASATTTYTQEYDGFSSTCPSYAYQIGMICDPVYTAQTAYQSESLGQLSYCPAPDRYTGSYYTCSPVYHQQTTTTSLGQLSYCPSGTSGTQYSCTPEYQSRTTSLGQMSYCPSGSQYSCSAVYSAYTYWVTETVPVVTAVTYETLSTLGSAWLIGG